jgi:hypothetical protein
MEAGTLQLAELTESSRWNRETLAAVNSIVGYSTVDCGEVGPTLNALFRALATTYRGRGARKDPSKENLLGKILFESIDLPNLFRAIRTRSLIKQSTNRARPLRESNSPLLLDRGRFREQRKSKGNWTRGFGEGKIAPPPKL